MSRFILSAFADEIDDDLNIQMEVLAKFGIRHIEMRGVGGKNLVEYDLGQVRQIADTLAQSDIDSGKECNDHRQQHEIEQAAHERRTLQMQVSVTQLDETNILSQQFDILLRQSRYHLL